MRNKSAIKYLLIISILFIAGCPNAMIGLGDKVDIEAPEVSIGNYGDGSPIINGDYVKGEIILTGSTSDDIGIRSVKLSFDGGLNFSNATVASDQLSWSFTIDTATVEDGEKDIIILVTDTSSSPKTNEVNLLLYFDNTAPLVLITDPAGYDDPDGKPLAIIPIKGETYDEFRISSVEITLLTGGGTVDSVAGIASWSSALRSTGTGDYTISVTATDYAGNISQGFYHLEDIMEANADTYITVKDIYDIREGALVQDVGLLEAADLTNPAIHLTELPISIDLSLDEPQIAISNPDPAAAAAENVLPANSTAFGSVSDNYAVQPDSVTISIDGGAYVDVTSTSGSGAFIQWEHDLSALGSGEHTLQIYAEDTTGVFKYSTEVGFIINLGAPVVTITSPSLGEYINTSSFTIDGTATDGEGITDVEISTDNGSTWTAASITLNHDSTNINWTYTTGALSDGIISIKVRASDDNESTWSYTNLQVTVDTEDPTTSFYLPSNNSFVNGEVEIRGASSDNNSLLKTEIKVGDSRAWVELDDAIKYNWTYIINSLEYENDSDATEDPAGSGIYKLNVYSRVTDIAGNIVETIPDAYYFYIDNALDRPTVNIISPSNDVNLGGSVIVSGTSFDDDGAVYGVYMQIDVNTHDGDTPNFLDSVVLSDPIDFDGPGGNAAVGTIDETVWYPVDGKSPWSVELNTNGELYNTEAGHTGDIYIRARAIDKDGGALSITGEYKELHIRMDDTIPFIENIFPVTNSYENGVFKITGNVLDETQIKHLEISYNGGADYHYVIRNNDIQLGYSGYGIDTVTTSYTIDIDLNTSAVPDVGNVVSDDITIRMKVTDSTNYQTLYSLHYYIDNQDPTGGITTDLSNINGADTSATISGTANDSGVVSGVEKIVAYFEKSGTFYNPKNGDFTGTEPSDPTDDTYQIIIDDTSETLSGANSDGDGVAEELNVGDPYIWIFKFDSTNIGDGPVTLHYHVYDKSGNSVHYTEAGYIRNNPPVIDSITLATDINADGDILDASESVSFSSGYTATNFTVKNNRLNLTVNASGGNGTKRYSIKYGAVEKNGTLTDNSLLITDFTGMNDGAVNGSEFIIRVYDSTISDDADETEEMYDEITLNLTFDNVDDTNPMIDFGDFGKTFSLPVSGIYTDKVEQDVSDYNDNIVLSGDTRLGHLEYAVDSSHNGLDSDISGRVIFKGKSWDDQRIQRVSAIINSGTELTIAEWSGSGLLGYSSADWDFTVEAGTEEIDLVNGHNLNWNFEWDSSSLPNVVGNNITVEIKVYDFGYDFGTPANSTTSPVTDLIQIDVVPYITLIENNSSVYGISNEVIRSSTGKYSIDSTTDTNNYYKIHGFNFDNTDLDITLSPSPIIDPTDGTATNIDAEIRTTTVNLIEMDKNYSQSGYLTVFVNNIPAINNINNNSLTQNGEYNVTNPRSYMWNDNRYFHTWNITQILTSQTDSTFYYPSMVMNVDQPLFSYTNDNRGSTFRSTGDEATQELGRLWYERQTAYSYDDDGNSYVVSSQDAFSGGDIGYLYLGRRDNSRSAAYGDTNRGNYIELIGEDYISRQLNRFRYPQIIVDGPQTAARTYIAVYDAHPDEKDLKFFAFEVDGLISSNLTEPAGDTNVSGNGYISIPGTQDGASSQYFDMTKIGPATDINHKLIVAYYDESSSTLKVKFAINPVDGNGLYDAATTWNTISIESDYSYSGTYVSATNDGTDLYLSYYDSANANLKLAVIPGTLLVDTGASGSISTYTIDSYLSVGSWTNITMIGGLPYISYYSDSYNGTKSPIRMAYPISSLDHGVENGTSNEYNGNWEIISVPAISAPLGGMAQFNRTMIDKDSSNIPTVAWLASRIEYAKLFNP